MAGCEQASSKAVQKGPKAPWPCPLGKPSTVAQLPSAASPPLAAATLLHSLPPSLPSPPWLRLRAAQLLLCAIRSHARARLRAARSGRSFRRHCPGSTPPPSHRRPRGCGDEGLPAAQPALMAAALLMLLVSPAAPDKYEREPRRMFVEWKAKYKKTYKYAGEEECRYAVFKDSRRRFARSNAAGVTSSGLNGLSAHVSEEIFRGRGVRLGEGSYEEETRRMFVGWKARYGKTYRDVGEEECRYKLFKVNRRVVVKLNTAAAGETAYGLNQFGDHTNEEVRGCYDGRGGEMEGNLSTRCQAAVAGDIVGDYEKLIRSQVCRCIALELKRTESGGSAIPGDEAHMWI